MILGTREAYLNYIPFSLLALNEQPYRFRFADQPAVASLAASLARSGQTHPVTLLEASPEKYLVLDGHRRCDAIKLILENGGAWEKILAHVVPYGNFPLIDRFRLLLDKNINGESAYGLMERGQFFRDFIALGLTVHQIAVEACLAPHVVEDTIDLCRTRSSLSCLLNRSTIEPVYALMLQRRFEGWLHSPYAAAAETVAAKLLKHAETEKLTMKSWRFLLEFYWQDGRPFLS